MTDRKAPPHGWLILDKPRGLGSTQAVGMVKRVLRQGGYAKTKVGCRYRTGLKWCTFSGSANLAASTGSAVVLLALPAQESAPAPDRT